jgi:hypothetical protein
VGEAMLKILERAARKKQERERPKNEKTKSGNTDDRAA